MKGLILVPLLLFSINISAQQVPEQNSLDRFLSRNFNPGISLGAGGVHPLYFIPGFSVGFGFGALDFALIPFGEGVSGGAQLKFNLMTLSRGDRYIRRITMSGGIFSFYQTNFIFVLPGFNKTRIAGRHSIDFKLGYGRFLTPRNSYDSYRWNYFPYGQISITFYAFRFVD